MLPAAASHGQQSGQCDKTGSHMYYAGSGKVEESQFFQPGGVSAEMTAPGQSAKERIDQGGADGTGDKQRRQFCALRESPCEYSDRNCSEHDLQEYKCSVCRRIG